MLPWSESKLNPWKLPKGVNQKFKQFRSLTWFSLT